MRLTPRRFGAILPSPPLDFSLVIPLFNEEKNLPALVSMLSGSSLVASGMRQVVLVNNGSSDRTGDLAEESARTHEWITVLHLEENQNYGGGVYEGLTRCASEQVCYIPGDLQVQADDLEKVWRSYQKTVRATGETHLLVKGHRTTRKDGLASRFVSRIYTLSANLLLGVRVNDVNGLPKMFHKSLLTALRGERMTTFVFDVQLIQTARREGWRIEEVPVTFHARRQGVSSWSTRRLATYLETLRLIVALRRHR